MTGKLKSLLSGAALAGLLVIPTLPSSALGADGPPPAPAAPPAPPAPPPPPMPHGGDFTHWGLRSFPGQELKVDDLVGTLIVTVSNGGPITVEAWGSKYRVNGLHVDSRNGAVEVEGSGYDENYSVWDWKHWFDFSHFGDTHESDLTVRVSVPRGADVNIDSLVGNATIGDTYGRLKLDAAATTANIGRVQSADIDLGGSGKIQITAVSGPLNLDIGGSGKLITGPVGSVNADIAGSGDAYLGPIAGGLKLDIAGSGDLTAPRVNGPVSVDIAGSGSIKIADGVADPLHIEIMGAGNFTFGGVAVDPHVESFGSGEVRLKSYRGKLTSEGMADVKIGQQ